MRAHTNVSLKDRKQLTLSNFRGADFSSSVTQAASARATKMRNLISRGGVNRKRNGWNEILQIEGNPNINGVFEYNDTLIVHAGTRFYRAIKEGDTYICTDITESCTREEAKITTTLKNQRSQAFFQNDRLHIIGCGDYLVYGRWGNGLYELRRVKENEDTHVPVIARSYHRPNLITEGKIEILEAPNLLTRKRTVLLFGTNGTPTASAADGSKAWAWDMPDKLDTNKLVTVEMDIVRGGSVITRRLENVDAKGKNGEDLYITYAEDSDELKGKVHGSCGFSSLYIDFDTAPPDEAEPNITVTYYAASESTDISKTSFGITYGVDGNLDRLFLAGNPQNQATIFYSAMDDFTYFPDVNTISVGSSSVPITGFAHLSDNALGVFKKDSSKDSSFYTLGGTYKSTADENGTTTSFSALFPKSAGAEGEGALNAHTCANLAGDTLLLSKNGVFGIALQENVMTTIRCTRERSRLIAERLKSHKDLSAAVAAVYDGRYYLAIDDVCYIADSRYKFNATANDGSFDYEWWYWDNVPVNVWAEIDGKLAFGTKDGRICVFDEAHVDRTYVHTTSGALSLDTTNGAIDCEKNLYDSVSDGQEITVNSEGLYALIEANANAPDGRVVTENKNGIFAFYEGMQLYAEGLTSSGPYTVTNIDFGKGEYSLKTEKEEIVTTDAQFSLYRSLSGERLFIEKDSGRLFLKEAKEGARMHLSAYEGSTPTEILATIRKSTPVVSEWVTPVFDLGTGGYSKTLLKMTLAAAPETHGKLLFGYATRSAERMLSKKGNDLFSFEDLSFNAFSFESGFANSYSVRCNERNFNYIFFRFRSEDEGDCAVSDFSIVYKINRENKGVR